MITKPLHATRMLDCGELGISQAEDRAATAALRDYIERPGIETQEAANMALAVLPAPLEQALKQAARI